MYVQALLIKIPAATGGDRRRYREKLKKKKDPRADPPNPPFLLLWLRQRFSVDIGSRGIESYPPGVN